MGWSCRADAGRTLDAFTRMCRDSTGMSNTYEAKGKRFFFEVSNTEHEDGAITGTIARFINESQCVSAGSFRINGDGSIARAPAALKAAAKNYADNRPAGNLVSIGSGGY